MDACIIVMKQQFQNSREELISHIQTQLSFLKQQRDSLLAKPNVKEEDNKIKISNYLEGQGSSHVQKQKERIRPQSQVIAKELQAPVQSKTQMIEARNKAKQQAEVLRQLYERKRQLESIGIIENDPQKIKKIFENKQTAKQIQKNLVKYKEREQQKQQRHKIIQQQLTKVQSFLKQPKKNIKGKSSQSQYIYSQLLQGKQQKLSQYQQLLHKNRLTIVEKEKLLEMTFDLIKQYSQRVPKNFLEDFLLANQQFCRVFSITKEEIMRDLKVHSTEEPGFLSYRQFYEFVKSIEITNKTIKPNLKYQNKTVKQTKKKVTVKQENATELSSKQFEQYIKKVYLYLDQKREKIVERQRLEIAFAKCLLFDEKKAKSLKKENISNFAAFIKSKRESTGNKSYYKSLDMKYIGLQELQDLYKQFQQFPSNKSTFSEEKDKETQQNQVEQDEMDIDFSPQIVNFVSNLPTPEEIDDRSDMQKYGWGQDKPQTQKFSQLTQLDKYYKQMSGKYGNEIHWNNHKVYQQDFKKFNQSIAQMKQNHSPSQQIVGLNFPVREEEEQLQSSQQFQ